jgi:hypothetical protein
MKIKRPQLAQQVLSIKFALVRDRQLITPNNLLPTGQSGHQLMHAGLDEQGNQVMLVKQRRAWPNKNSCHLSEYSTMVEIHEGWTCVKRNLRESKDL